MSFFKIALTIGVAAGVGYVAYKVAKKPGVLDAVARAVEASATSYTHYEEEPTYVNKPVNVNVYRETTQVTAGKGAGVMSVAQVCEDTEVSVDTFEYDDAIDVDVVITDFEPAFLEEVSYDDNKMFANRF